MVRKMIYKVKEWFKSVWIYVVIAGTLLLGICIFIINALFSKKQVDDQIDSNNSTLKKVEEEKKEDEKIVDNIDATLSGSPFERARNKKSK